MLFSGIIFVINVTLFISYIVLSTKNRKNKQQICGTIFLKPGNENQYNCGIKFDKNFDEIYELDEVVLKVVKNE